MTATSGTSPRAQRAARRGEASRLQGQRQEELVGQEGAAAQEEPTADAVGAGVEETGSPGVAAVAGPGLMWEEEPGVAAEDDSTGVGRETHLPAAAPAAASGDDSFVPAALQPAVSTAPTADGDLAAEEAQVERGLAGSPAPVVATSPSTLGEREIAVVVAEAARQ
ncbi:unnamed protein product [Closterium sp. Yama58-4]|nr:unnamed protein product [Closterium sp. Yama58-4]